MGSSIIFLVVVGIWAAFLLPDLQLRRHRLSQARAAEAISESARILRRSNHVGRGRHSGDVTGDGDASGAGEVSGDEATPNRALVPSDPARRQLSAASAAPQKGSGTLSGTVRATLGAVAILAALAVPATVGLAAFSVLPWQSALMAAGLMVVVLAGLRLRARHLSRRGGRPEKRFPVPQAQAQAQTQTDGALAESAPAEAERRQARITRPGDVAFDRAAFEAPADTTVSVPRPGEWTPRPVPVPSYLSKPSLPAPGERGQLLDARPMADPFADLLSDGGTDTGEESHLAGERRDGGAARAG